MLLWQGSFLVVQERGMERSEGLEKRLKSRQRVRVKPVRSNFQSPSKMKCLPEKGNLMILWLRPKRTEALHALLLDVPLGGSAVRLFNLVLSDTLFRDGNRHQLFDVFDAEM